MVAWLDQVHLWIEPSISQNASRWSATHRCRDIIHSPLEGLIGGEERTGFRSACHWTRRVTQNSMGRTDQEVNENLEDILT